MTLRPLLQISLTLSLELMRETRTSDKSRLDDHAKLSSFLDALTTYVGKSILRPAPEKVLSNLLRRWGNTPHYLQLRVVATAEQLGCRDQLKQVLGTLPLPEQSDSRPRHYEPMF